MEIVIASKNVHKIREIREILSNLENIDITSLLNFADYEPPPEDGSTFEENATVKAVDAAKALNKWTLGEDSGLVVPALDGAPGIYSKRYSGEDATDAENRRKLLDEMQGKKELERAAYYECNLVLASPDGEVKKYVRGICEGYLITEEKGNHGFGYDSLFVKHDYDKTFGEIEEAVKNKVSHRYKAVEKMIPILESL